MVASPRKLSRRLSDTQNAALNDALKQAFKTSGDDQAVAADKVAELVDSSKGLDLADFAAKINNALADSDANTREVAARIVAVVAKNKSTRVEPYTPVWIPNLLDAYSDKKINVRGPAAEAAKALIQSFNESA
ncbi:unnamed protein product, partial [Aphanomyces euteiches]